VTFTRLLQRVEAEIGVHKRYAHCVRVARLADRLAQRHGADPAKARVAGMLHDLARLYSKERLMRECSDRHMAIGPFERDHPVVLHARLGAELARERFGIADEAILSAIRKHTVGGATMTTLDEIVYLADALEPGRDYADRAALEAIAMRDLRAGMQAVLAASAAMMRARGKAVAPETEAALAAYGPVHA
jgi:predicted HD superfamily hydrolase involved in NAD metabolism